MQYKVYKEIDGQFYYEGKGNIDYVNRVLKAFAQSSIVLKIEEI